MNNEMPDTQNLYIRRIEYGALCRVAQQEHFCDLTRWLKSDALFAGAFRQMFGSDITEACLEMDTLLIVSDAERPYRLRRFGSQPQEWK